MSTNGTLPQPAAAPVQAQQFPFTGGQPPQAQAQQPQVVITPAPSPAKSNPVQAAAQQVRDRIPKGVSMPKLGDAGLRAQLGEIGFSIILMSSIKWVATTMGFGAQFAFWVPTAVCAILVFRDFTDGDRKLKFETLMIVGFWVPTTVVPWLQQTITEFIK